MTKKEFQVMNETLYKNLEENSKASEKSMASNARRASNR